jgi:hypothetical protein
VPQRAHHYPSPTFPFGNGADWKGFAGKIQDQHLTPCELRQRKFGVRTPNLTSASTSGGARGALETEQLRGEGGWTALLLKSTQASKFLVVCDARCPFLQIPGGG